MNIFNNISRSFTAALLCILYGLLQAFAFRWLVSFSFLQLVADGVVDALFFVGLSSLLWKVIKYGNYETLEIHQRFLNYVVLGLLAVALWIGLSYFSSYLMLGEKYLPEVANMLPMKAFIALLTYLLIVQFFQARLAKMQTQEPVQEDAEEVLLKPDTCDEEEEIQPLERIVAKTGQKIHVIMISEIVYFQAEGDYVRIFTDTGKFLKEDTMKYFQARLPEQEFVRVHRSYLVNITKILRIELYEKQSQQLTLSNGDKIKISVSGYRKLRETLGL